MQAGGVARLTWQQLYAYRHTREFFNLITRNYRVLNVFINDVHSLLFSPATKRVVKRVVADATVFSLLVFITNSSSRTVGGAREAGTNGRNPRTLDTQSLPGINNMSVPPTRKRLTLMSHINSLRLLIARRRKTHGFPPIGEEALARGPKSLTSQRKGIGLLVRARNGIPNVHGAEMRRLVVVRHGSGGHHGHGGIDIIALGLPQVTRIASQMSNVGTEKSPIVLGDLSHGIDQAPPSDELTAGASSKGKFGGGTVVGNVPGGILEESQGEGGDGGSSGSHAGEGLKG